MHALLRLNHLSESSYVYPGLLLRVKAGEEAGESGSTLDDPEVTCSSSAPFKLPVSYITPLGEVQGVLSVTPFLMMFDAIAIDHIYTIVHDGDRNTKYPAVQFQACVDVQDIVYCAPIAAPELFVHEKQEQGRTGSHFLHFTLHAARQATEEASTRLFVTFRYEGRMRFDLNSICSFINRVVMENTTLLPVSSTYVPYTDSSVSEQLAPQSPLQSFSPLNGAETDLLSERMALQIRVHLSPVMQLKTWKLLYSSAKHGFSYSVLLYNCQARGPSVIVLMDSSKFVFGGFASASWEVSKGYFGTGDSFIFTFRDGRDLLVYEPTYINEYYLACDADCLSMGSDPRPGLSIYRDLLNGVSSACQTFNNAPLASSEFFKILNIEIWGFE